MSSTTRTVYLTDENGNALIDAHGNMRTLSFSLVQGYSYRLVERASIVSATYEQIVGYSTEAGQTIGGVENANEFDVGDFGIVQYAISDRNNTIGYVTCEVTAVGIDSLTVSGIGISVSGKDGTNGASPTIGKNGHWYIGEEDTGVVAQGRTGASALVYKKIYQTGGNPEVDDTYTWTFEQDLIEEIHEIDEYFNRLPKVGDVFQMVHINVNENKSFVCLMEVTQYDLSPTQDVIVGVKVTSVVETTGKTGADGADGADGQDGKDYLFYSAICKSSAFMGVSYNLNIANFNRTPVLNDRFLLIRQDPDTGTYYLCNAKISAVGETVVAATVDSEVELIGGGSGGEESNKIVDGGSLTLSGTGTTSVTLSSDVVAQLVAEDVIGAKFDVSGVDVLFNRTIYNPAAGSVSYTTATFECMTLALTGTTVTSIVVGVRSDSTTASLVVTEISVGNGGGGSTAEVTKEAIATALNLSTTQLDVLVSLAQKVTITGNDVKFATGTVLKSSYFDAVD